MHQYSFNREVNSARSIVPKILAMPNIGSELDTDGQSTSDELYPPKMVLCDLERRILGRENVLRNAVDYMQLGGIPNDAIRERVQEIMNDINVNTMTSVPVNEGQTLVWYQPFLEQLRDEAERLILKLLIRLLLKWLSSRF